MFVFRIVAERARERETSYAYTHFIPMLVLDMHVYIYIYYIYTSSVLQIIYTSNRQTPNKDSRAWNKSEGDRIEIDLYMCLF